MPLPAINNLSTVLSSNVDDVQTTIPVTTTAGFPSEGVFSVEFEAIHYTGVTANSFTGCTRGFDNTAAAAHAGGNIADLRIIAAHLTEIWQELELVGESSYRQRWNDVSPRDIATIDSSRFIAEIEVQVVTPFNGIDGSPAKFLTLGTPSDPDLFFQVEDTEIGETPAFYSKAFHAQGPLTVRLTCDPGQGPTAGEAIIIIRVAKQPV